MTGLLLLAQLRFVLRAPWSLAVAMLGLVLGIASVVAVHLLTQQLVVSLDAGVPAHLRLANAVVTAPALTAKDYFDLRRAWRAGELPEVRALAPVVEGSVLIEGRSVQVVGADWLALLGGDERPFALGDSDAAGDSVRGSLPLLDGVFVTGNAGVALGARLRPDTAGSTEVTVRGIVDTGKLETPAVVIYADIATAIDLLGADPAQLSLIAMRLRDPRAALRGWLRRLMPGLDAGLADSPRVTVPVRLADGPGESRGLVAKSLRSQLPEQAFGRSILFNLGALSLLALLVAWFLLYQTAVLWLRRQWPMFELLFYQGVSLYVCGAVFGFGMVLLGVICGVGGLGAGYALAQLLLAQTFATVGFTLPALSDSPWLLLKALLSAVLVPAFAAWLGFQALQVRREGNAAPARPAIQALLPWLWQWLPLGWAALALIAAAWLIQAPATGLFGAFGAILLLCSIGIVGVAPTLRLLRRWVFGAQGRWLSFGNLNLLLGMRDLLQHPRDLSAALSALILAVATSVGIATMVASFREDFTSMLEQRLQASVALEGAATELARAATDPALADNDVELAGRYRLRLPVNGQPVELRLSRFDERFARQYGLASVPAADAVLINERGSRLLALAPGDALSVLGRERRVVAVFPGYGDAGLKLLAALPATLIGAGQPPPAALAMGDQRAVLDQLSIHTTQDPVALAARLRDVYPSLEVAEREAIRTQALAVFDQTFAITRSLTTLALLVAAVGLYSALVAIGLLQAPTQRLLTFLGQTRRERFEFLCGRSLTVSLVTVTLAVPLGLLLAWLLCTVVNPRGFGWTVPLSWSAGALFWPLGLAAAAGLAAGLFSGGRERV